MGRIIFRIQFLNEGYVINTPAYTIHLNCQPKVVIGGIYGQVYLFVHIKAIDFVMGEGRDKVIQTAGP